MACDAPQLLVDACESGIADLSDRALRVLIAQKLCSNMAECNPQQLLIDACASGIADMSERQVDLIIAQALCEDAGGGGAGTNYLLHGAADPVADPADITETWRYTNTTTGTEWIWPSNGAAWQQVV